MSIWHFLYSQMYGLLLPVVPLSRLCTVQAVQQPVLLFVSGLYLFLQVQVMYSLGSKTVCTISCFKSIYLFPQVQILYSLDNTTACTSSCFRYILFSGFRYILVSASTDFVQSSQYNSLYFSYCFRSILVSVSKLCLLQAIQQPVLLLVSGLYLFLQVQIMYSLGSTTA